MNILSKASDAIVSAITKTETVRLPCEELTRIVVQEFISGFDNEFLAQVLKAAKGGLLSKKELISRNGRYTLQVGCLQQGWIFGLRKTVWVFDNQENKYYQLDKDRKWGKFYKAIETAIKMEKINRSR